MLTVKPMPTLMLSSICEEFKIAAPEAASSFLFTDSFESTEILNVSEEYLNYLSSAIQRHPENKRYINEDALVRMLRSMGYEEYVIIFFDC